MIVKLVKRYYSDCGKGFWSKNKALTHDGNCKCWKNEKFKACLSCVHKRIVWDSNGMEHEPQYLERWKTNMCEYSDSGIAVTEDIDYIRKDCQHHKSKKPIEKPKPPVY